MKQVGTKMGLKIDVNFERPILHRILMIFEVREIEKSIKNGSKIDQTSNMLVPPASIALLIHLLAIHATWTCSS